MNSIIRVGIPLMLALTINRPSLGEEGDGAHETLAEIGARLSNETYEAYVASPYAFLFKNYFLRFYRDPDAQPGENETDIDSEWRIVYPEDADPLVEAMAGYLEEFFEVAMKTEVKAAPLDDVETGDGSRKTITLRQSGKRGETGAFEVEVDEDRVLIHGESPEGVRDGVVKMADRMGFRQAPILKRGKQSFKPRLAVRLGTVPYQGTYRDLIFMGFNAVFAGGGDLHAISTSKTIPELAERQVPNSLEGQRQAVAQASRHGLKTFAFLSTKQKFPKNHPVFQSHPEIRGAMTWKEGGDHVLCTEHPLVKQYLEESVRELFSKVPELNGVTIIIGGEGFYHCYMRPYGVEKGHTNCPRCEEKGAETVVANLCNRLARAAREVNPEALVVAWPYSAEHVWSADKAQEGFISKLGPGTAIFTEIEKSEYVTKANGVRKHLWDYSIDMIGPGERAAKQIAACRKQGIPIFLKSEPEIGFEAPRLPHIPCHDRWAERAQALASCGADGAWVFPAFRPCYGTSAAEVAKHFWWDPAPKKEDLLARLADRIAGPKAGPHLREAWRLVSEAIPHSPELPPYYTGPYYLGPAHPMIANPEPELPEVFYGLYLFRAEITASEGLKKLPTFFKNARGDVPAFEQAYRKMEELLGNAVAEIEAAKGMVPESHRLTFQAEESPIRWFYHTARTHANFYESCRIRDRLLGLAEKESLSAEDGAEAKELLKRWKEVLHDEKENSEKALPVMEADVRLDMRFGGDHTFSHGADMIRAKLEILDKEITEFLPNLAKRLGV